MSQYSDLTCFTIFKPNFNDSGSLPIDNYSIRNAFGFDEDTGDISEEPFTVEAGHYCIKCPDTLDVKRISIINRAYDASGNIYIVETSVKVVSDGTIFNIYIYGPNDSDVFDLTAAFSFCEVTVRSLPIA